MTRALSYGAVLLSILSFAACGGGGNSIKSTPPQGSISSQAWTMSKATVTSDGTNLSVYLFGESVADCATSDPNMGFILFTVPAKTGERQLQLSLSDLSSPDNQTLTFVTPPSNNNIAVDGTINVTALTSNSVTMGLEATAGADNVNGTFTVNLCPSP
jgi:hypothetical protein